MTVFGSLIGRKYRLVLGNDRDVLQMSSIDPGSSSSSAFPDQPHNLSWLQSLRGYSALIDVPVNASFSYCSSSIFVSLQLYSLKILVFINRYASHFCNTCA
ncbi:uncharacterized protein LOC131618447 [Vicia villosa]|uniref:uncharacterized protein LOC131618447 n=1 Tax=Vicia villosa TaxID=3911 RepID=UPI00273C43FC|nr:uncharacterized protein LOC131618447 [Vicia villosa]